MTKYELLIDAAWKAGANIYEVDLGVELPCGKCIGDSLIINKNANSDEKLCVLAEELGHYETTIGDIADLTKFQNKKQELKARAWGYNKIIGLKGIVNAFNYGYKDPIEIAEFFNVTLEYLNDAINYYTSKYGAMCKFKEYTIFFYPSLRVIKSN